MNTFAPIEKTLPQLIKASSTYKLIIPEDVEGKIRYLLRKFPSTEWSGVLFYTHEGNFEDDNLVLTCKDIYPMDLGSSGFTSFKMTPEVTNYIANNIELFDCETGLLHSHHLMDTFFSSTDLSTLQKEGNDTNCFLSLIVNTAGTYSAAITRKIKTEVEVTTKSLNRSYEFFGEGEVSPDNDTAPSKRTVTKEYIQYFMLDIERHEVSNPYKALDERFEQIEKSRVQPKEPIHTFDWLNGRYQLEHPFESRKVKEPYLFDDNTMNSVTNTPEWTPDKQLVHACVCKLISCSLIINTEKFDLKQWITKHLDNMYEKIFCDDSQFDEWVSYAIDTLVYHFMDETAPNSLDMNDDEYYSAVAAAMIDELEPYKGNKHIDKYIKELSTLIM